MSSRLLKLNDKTQTNGKCVLYVISRDTRVSDNHALLLAQKSALESKLPLIVLFNLLPKSGNRSKEHYDFLIDGLEEFSEHAKKLNINFIMTYGTAYDEILLKINQLKPKEVFFDFSPLRGPRHVQKRIAKSSDCRVSVVDNHNIVPVWITSDKEEFAAHTIRPKIHKEINNWLIEPDKMVFHPFQIDINLPTVTFKMARNYIDRFPKSNLEPDIKPGENAANEVLRSFIKQKLRNYSRDRNLPDIDGQTNLSPYLHFGNISSLRIALDVVSISKDLPLIFREPKMPTSTGEPTLSESIDAILEELIVRKELSDNYCFYNDNYDNFAGAKLWARDSLESHINDIRQTIYSIESLELANTHDTAWNAAQLQMTKTGKMHGYMRMYWAKKILEWSNNPQEAIDAAIYLNDKYSLDGGDPNGYTGIMWSIAGVHDRPWFDREVYGKIRYMNQNGLSKKFNLESYVNKWTTNK